MTDHSRRTSLLKRALDNGGYLSGHQLSGAKAGAGAGGRPDADKLVLRRLVAEGLLVRRRRGLYVLTGALADDRNIWIAKLAESLDGVVSHQSAARLLGFSVTRPFGRAAGRGHLTVLYPRAPDPPAGIVVHRTRHLRASDLRLHRGVRATSPLRTLVDLAAPSSRVPFDSLVDFFDHLVATRLTTVRAAEDYVSASPRLNGMARTRRLLAQMASSEVESNAERRLLRLLQANHLPSPATQYVLRSGSGLFLARLDCAWPAHRVALEIDGYRYHSTIRAFRHDRERGTLIQKEGWALYRTTPAEIETGAPILVSALRHALSTAMQRTATTGDIN